MKLVIDLRMINVSGIGTYLKNIVPAVIKTYKDTILLGDIQELREFTWATDVKIIEFTENIYSVKEQLLFPTIIPRCDVFWCPHFNVPIFPIKATNIITTIYDVNHLSSINKSSWLKKQYAKLLYINATKRSKIIITISEFSKRELVQHTKVNEQKIALIYCGVDKEKFIKKNQSRSYLKLPEKYILFVGNIKPHKNLITLLKAYASLKKEMQNEYKIVIVGKKEGFITKENKIFSFIENQNLINNIHFTGYIPDDQVPYVYTNAALFVFPSLYEGFGLPLLEAMCAETPVISSDAASLKEVGANAVEYFSPLDYEVLTQKIEKIITNPELQNDLIKKGLKQVDNFTWQESANKHCALFNNHLP